MSDTRGAISLSCGRIEGLLDAYLDGDLSTADERAVRCHAHGCADCGREMDRAVACRNLLRSTEPIRTSPGFRGAVLAGVRAEQARRERRSRMFRILVPTLGPALAAALALGFLLPRSHDAPLTPTARTPIIAQVESEQPEVAVATSPEPNALQAEAAALPKPTTSPMEARLQSGKPRQEPAAIGQPPAVRSRPDGPSYLTAKLVESPAVAERPAAAPEPVILANVPEPEAVFVATSRSTYSL